MRGILKLLLLLLRLNEGGDASMSGLVRACEWEGLEQSGESVRGHRGGGTWGIMRIGSSGWMEPPIVLERGHVYGSEGEDMEETLFSPAWEELGCDVSERGGRLAETHDGVGDVELVLAGLLGDVRCEVVGGEMAIEVRELARELQSAVTSRVVRELIEGQERSTVTGRARFVSSAGSRVSETEQGHDGLMPSV